MLDDDQYNSVYVHFSTMDTDELTSVDVTTLSQDEGEIYNYILSDRREEIIEMIAYMQSAFVDSHQKKHGHVVKVPVEIFSKLQTLDRSEFDGTINHS